MPIHQLINDDTFKMSPFVICNSIAKTFKIIEKLGFHYLSLHIQNIYIKVDSNEVVLLGAEDSMQLYGDNRQTSFNFHGLYDGFQEFIGKEDLDVVPISQWLPMWPRKLDAFSIVNLLVLLLSIKEKEIKEFPKKDLDLPVGKIQMELTFLKEKSHYASIIEELYSASFNELPAKLDQASVGGQNM